MPDVIIDGSGISLTLSELLSELNDLAALDLEDPEAKRLLNEGYIKLVCESGWNRANITYTGVTDQEAYELDSSIYRILKVFVGGYVYSPQDEESIVRQKVNEIWRRGNGTFWLSFDEVGAESLSIYPTATEDDEIVVLSIVRPALLENDDDEPSACPREFQRGIVDYAAAIALGSVEDAVDLRAFHMQEFERALAGLAALRNSRVGQGPRQVRVQGIHY